MIKIGNYNRLKVSKIVDFGVYLDGGNNVEILLPARYINELPEIGDEMDVFIYTDSEDRLIATTERPFATVGQFAFLQVNAVNRIGAFLDWGLPKDLLVPFSEQKAKMKDGGIYLVYVYLDDATKRVVASSKIEKFIGNVIPDYKMMQSVKVLPYKHVEIGYKCIVENSHYGMIYENELFKPITIGEEIEAYVKHIREDFKIDLTLNSKTLERITEISEKILLELQKEGGKIEIGDKSDPELIKARFGCSKKDFKKALGALYKQKIIELTDNSIIKSRFDNKC